MRTWISIATCAIVLSVANGAIAQTKTVRACQAEWRADKAANQAKGITEKTYVEQCRAGAGAARPGPSAPAASNPSAPRTAAAPASNPQKTVKACRDEWRASKDAYRAEKVTERAYVEKCRAGEAVALPGGSSRSAPTAAAPAPSQSASTPSIAPPAAPSSRQARPAAPPPATQGRATTGPDQFQTEAQAKTHCPGDLVVWANLKSKVYHFAGHKSYGTTKQGAYMCEKEASAEGFRASRTEKRPST